MSEMVERVARALARSKSAAQPGGWIERWINENWHLFKDDARTAIAAMREPTEGMENAAWRSDQDRDTGLVPKNVWQAMIDEALK